MEYSSVALASSPTFNLGTKRGKTPAVIVSTSVISPGRLKLNPEENDFLWVIARARRTLGGVGGKGKGGGGVGLILKLAVGVGVLGPLTEAVDRERRCPDILFVVAPVAMTSPFSGGVLGTMTVWASVE